MVSFCQMKYRPLNFPCAVSASTCVGLQQCFVMWLLTVVHRSLYSAKQSRPGKPRNTASSAQQQQQQAVVRQRLEHAELCGFKPIDSPTAASAGTRKQTAAKSGAEASSESSSNPFSGEEYY